MGQSANDPKVQRAFIENNRPSSIIKRLAKPQEIAESSLSSVRAKQVPLPARRCGVDGGVVMSIT
jgi:hypothetical protein